MALFGVQCTMPVTYGLPIDMLASICAMQCVPNLTSLMQSSRTWLVIISPVKADALRITYKPPLRRRRIIPRYSTSLPAVQVHIPHRLIASGDLGVVKFSSIVWYVPRDLPEL